MAYASNSEGSEKVSKLKNASGSSKLPYRMLVQGTEGIKDAITGFIEVTVAGKSGNIGCRRRLSQRSWRRSFH